MITGGETIVLYDLEESLVKKTFKSALEIVYEDDFLAIINKPAGILVSGNKLKTIVNALPFNLHKSTQPDVLSFPLPVHRLDFPTSGLLIVAKTNKTLVAFGKMFEKKQIFKTYHAIAIGVITRGGIIETVIQEKKSYTKYEVLENTRI